MSCNWFVCPRSFHHWATLWSLIPIYVHILSQLPEKHGQTIYWCCCSEFHCHGEQCWPGLSYDSRLWRMTVAAGKCEDGAGQDTLQMKLSLSHPGSADWLGLHTNMHKLYHLGFICNVDNWAPQSTCSYDSDCLAYSNLTYIPYRWQVWWAFYWLANTHACIQMWPSFTQFTKLRQIK